MLPGGQSSVPAAVRSLPWSRGGANASLSSRLIWSVFSRGLARSNRALFTVFTAHPTTSYFYPSSPGFHWIQNTSADPISIAHPDLPTGRWRWSFSGEPSSPDHPLAERQTLLPINWPLVVFGSPAALGWLLYVTGMIGEADGPVYLAWRNWLAGATFALFPIMYWWAGD